MENNLRNLEKELEEIKKYLMVLTQIQRDTLNEIKYLVGKIKSQP